MENKCIQCGTDTAYTCLTCKVAVCNKSGKCSVFAPETVEGWKAGYCVGNCMKCNDNLRLKNDETRRSFEIVSVKNPTCGSNRGDVSARKTETVKPKAKATSKRQYLDLSQRVELLAFHKKTPTFGVRKLAEKFGCGKTQVSLILKSEKQILAEWESNEGRPGKKRGRQQNFPHVNDCLWKWYVTCRNSNIPVSGPMLQEEALLIAQKLGEDTVNFAASNGWLDRWKKRYNITQMNVAGEEGDVNEETMTSWAERARELVRGYQPADVWNMDETGLFWKALPEKSLSERGKRCRGGKKAKQRLTWAFFVNAGGGKEPPIVIGKSVKPRCFKSLKDKNRPYSCHYFANKKAWMTSEIFEEIVHQLNRRMKHQNCKIILFIDNAPCHPPLPSDHFTNIKLAFLPKNTTSRSQPLDAGIIKQWKVKTKRMLLRYVCSKVDGKLMASEITKSVHVLMSIQWGKKAWDEISEETIKKCFLKVGLFPEEIGATDEDDDPFAGEEMQSLEELCTMLNMPDYISAQEFLDAEDELTTCEELINSDVPTWRDDVRASIIQEILHESSEPQTKQQKDMCEVVDDDNEDNDFDCNLREPVITSTFEALRTAEQLAEFAEFRGHEDLSNAMLNVTDILRDYRLREPRKQTFIDSFFK